MRLLRALLGGIAWGLLGLAALAGVALSAGALLAASDLGRPLVARLLVDRLDAALAGRLELEGLAVLPNGGVEVQGLRVFDPEGDLVLAVDRARVFADVRRLRNRVIGLDAEIVGPSVLIREEADGGVSIARAFAPADGPARPERPAAPRPAPARARGPAWTVRVGTLTVTGADVWWVDAAGETRLEASGLELAGRGSIGPDRARVRLSLHGRARAPLDAPIELEVRAARDGDLLRAPVLRVRAGGTVAEALGEWDLARRAGRVALVHAEVEREQVRRLVPDAPAGGDLALAAYAESDGATATAALHLDPLLRAGSAAAGSRAGSPGDGGGDAAVAVRMDGARALGLDVDLDRLDPARVHAAAPPGSVTLRARAGLAGTAFATLRGHAVVALARSRLRDGALGPVDADVAVDGGAWDVRRLAARAPGLAVDGSGRWRHGGAVGGKFTVATDDLAAAARNLEALLGEALPPLAGRARADATLSGTASAPALDARIDAPALGSGDVRASGLHGEVRLQGPLDALGGRADLEVAAVRSGRDELARALLLRAEVTGGVARLSASASVPALGHDPVTVVARGRREGPKGEALLLEELALGYPGTRYALARPARVALEGPAVEALELAAGDQRIRLSGGVGQRGALDARLAVSRLALERLPRALVPEGLAGRLDAEAEATGTTRRPRVTARVAVDDGRLATLERLAVRGGATWDGAARRLAASASVTQGAAAVDATVDLPLPLEGRPAAPVSASVRFARVTLEEVLRAAGAEDVPASGLLRGEATLHGTVGHPALAASAALEAGAYDDLEDVSITVEARAPGDAVTVDAAVALAGAPAATGHAEVRLGLDDLLVAPGRLGGALRRAPLTADVRAPALALAPLSGRLGLPRGLGGALSATVHAEGTLDAPRGDARLALADGAVAGYRELSARLDAAAEAARVTAAGEVGLAGEPVLRFRAALDAPLRRLGTRAGLRAAPLTLDAELPRSATALGRAAGPDVPVAGTLEGRLAATGTLAAPRVEGALSGGGVRIDGRPLGDLSATFRSAGDRATAEVALRPTSGGSVDARLAVEAPLSIDTTGEALRAAPAQASLEARALGLGFLPTLLPGSVRVASGTLEAHLTGKGPLARLSPRGTLAVKDGRVAVSEYGDWSGIAVEAAVSDDGVELPRLEARRGRGRLSVRGSVRGLASGTGKLTGRVETSQLTIARAGMDLATVDLELDASGAVTPRKVDARLDVRSARVRLPKKAPRTLQPLENRKDIVVGQRPRQPRATSAAARRPAAAGPREPPFETRVRAVAPGKIVVVSDSPRLQLELKADVTYELQGSDDYATGAVEVVRGYVEPIGGRTFDVRRGKVTFTGAAPANALLDVEAVWQNPTAVVTVKVAGELDNPDIKLSSEPPLDEAQIALLIATGRTELKPGAEGTTGISGQEAGRAAAGAIATQLFREVVADKLPFDVALDASTVRAGRYVTDKIYVGYTHRLEAPVLTNEQNPYEVRIEYQITPRWTLESRYGEVQSNVSLVWSRDY